MSIQRFLTHSDAETQQVAFDVARSILQKPKTHRAVILGLSGNLGAGKTTFMQGFARGLGITEVINSPTFVVMKRFAIQYHDFRQLYHIDSYRLDSPEDILALGFENIIQNPEHVVAIEWSERIAVLLPQEIIRITLHHIEEGQREILIDIP